MTPKKGSEVEVEANNDRRKFLAICGKFAVVTPPAITLLLSTSLNSTAVALSGGSGSNNFRDRDSHHEDRDHDHSRRDRD